MYECVICCKVSTEVILMVRGGVSVQRIPVNHPPVPGPGGLQVVEALPVAIGEDGQCPSVLGVVVEVHVVVHDPGDVVEPAGVAAHA